MIVQTLIDKLKKLPPDLEVVVRLEHLDKLPLRHISHVSLEYLSDHDPNNLDRVLLTTAIAHLNPVTIQTKDGE